MDILGQSALLVAVISFALGVSVLARNFRNTLFLNFFVFCSLLSAWALFFFTSVLWQSVDFYRVHLFFNLWITPAALLLIGQLIRIHDRWSRFFFWASVALATILTPALIFGLDRGGGREWLGGLGAANWVRQVVFFTPGFVLLQTLLLMFRDLRVTESRKTPAVGLGRNRLYIYAGALFTLSTSVMDHAPWLGAWVPVLGNIALTIYLFFLSQAITQQRLLNFGAILARFIVLTTIAVLLTGIYSLLFRWIANKPALFLLNSFIVSFLIVMSLDPFRAVVAYFAERWFSGKNLRLQVLLREGQRRLTGIVDLDSLFLEMCDFLDRTMRPLRASLFVLEPDGTRYRRASLREWRPSETPTEVREILAGSLLLEAGLREQRKGALPILFDAILQSELDRSASRTRRELLKGIVESLQALGGNLLIPLISGGEILGFMLIAVEEPPATWSGNWALLQVIYPYFEQAARTLKNLEVYVRSREKERLAALGEMAAGLAHEIRNPLGAIKGAAQFLDPRVDRPESRFLQVIVEEVDRLNRVVTQFLDYSKPFVAPTEPVDLLFVVQTTIELLRPTFPSEVKLGLTVMPDLQAQVPGSAERLKQVVMNLIQNSLKAVEGKRSGSIQMNLSSIGVGRRKEIVFTIEDNGSGISPENLKKLFIPFFTTSPGGTGLGLSISQKIIEGHGGHIDVSSEEGQFTRFSIYLPAARESFRPETIDRVTS